MKNKKPQMVREQGWKGVVRVSDSKGRGVEIRKELQACGMGKAWCGRLQGLGTERGGVWVLNHSPPH